MIDWAPLIVPGTILGVFSIIGLFVKAILEWWDKAQDRAAANRERIELQAADDRKKTQDQAAEDRRLLIDYLKTDGEKNTAHLERMESSQREEREAWRTTLAEHTGISKDMHTAIVDLTTEYKAHHIAEEKQQQLISGTLEDNTIATNKNTSATTELLEFIKRLRVEQPASYSQEAHSGT